MPSVVAVGIKTNLDGASLDGRPRAGVKYGQLVRPMVTVVGEASEIRVELGGYVPLPICHCDGHMTVAIFIVIVGMERNRGFGQGCVSFGKLRSYISVTCRVGSDLSTYGVSGS